MPHFFTLVRARPPPQFGNNSMTNPLPANGVRRPRLQCCGLLRHQKTRPPPSGLC